MRLSIVSIEMRWQSGGAAISRKHKTTDNESRPSILPLIESTKAPSAKEILAQSGADKMSVRRARAPIWGVKMQELLHRGI